MNISKATPSYFLKAAMLSRLHNRTCFQAGEIFDAPAAGRIPAGIVDYTGMSLREVRNAFESAFGPVVWLDSRKARQLATATFYAARYRALDRYPLIITVMGQALDRDADFVLSRVSKEARSMFNRSRQVFMELHRAMGFVRLSPVTGTSPPILVGKVRLAYDIADLVVRYFTRRHQGCKVYLLDGDEAYYQAGMSVKAVPACSLPFSLPEDDFSSLWEAYYDSQFVEGRKNLALAKKHLPKKYWSWVPEGNKLK